MLKRVFSPLTLGVFCALLLAACGSSNTNTTTTTSNANAARTTTTTTTTTNTAATNAAATTTTASAEKVGVPECDDYIAKYDACVTSKVPAAQRAQYESSLATMRKTWHDAAATPQGKAGLAQACKSATESARTSLKAYGCDF